MSRLNFIAHFTVNLIAPFLNIGNILYNEELPCSFTVGSYLYKMEF